MQCNCKVFGCKENLIEEVEVKFKKMKNPGSCITTKVLASPSHRRTPKKLKVVSTHVKRTSPKTLLKEKVITCNMFI